MGLLLGKEGEDLPLFQNRLFQRPNRGAVHFDFANPVLLSWQIQTYARPASEGGRLPQAIARGPRTDRATEHVMEELQAAMPPRCGGICARCSWQGPDAR